MSIQAEPPQIQLSWPIEEIVARLRSVRIHSLERRHRLGNPPKLPSRKALIAVLEGLGAALFPNRLGRPDLTDDGIDFYVGHTLDVALRALCDEILRELRYLGAQDDDPRIQARHAVDITREFADQLPGVRRVLDTDIRAAYEGDPAAHSADEVLVCYPGVTAVIYHRLAHALHALGAPLVARIIAEIAHSSTGIDIHPGAQIAGSFFIDHGTGVVIGETTVIGERVRLYQAVTLGAKRFPTDPRGTLLKGIPRHPIVEDDVVIYAGATVLGRITIGRGSTIGGNVWLTRSVPPDSNITQAHAHRESFHDGAGI
ncbi:MAG: serine O-acetyltransferase EpsC [Methylotetracoccus sp.]